MLYQLSIQTYDRTSQSPHLPTAGTVDLGSSAAIIRRDGVRTAEGRCYERLGFVASHEGMKLAL
jgi:hypothetical protein